MDNDLLYQIALTRIPQIGDVHARLLLSVFNEAAAIFKASKRQLESIEGIGTIRANNIKKFDAFTDCEKEIDFIRKFNIRPLFYHSDDYPKRLQHCYDSPPLLYFKGNADLNATRVISIVGTRSNSAYGKSICEQLIEELKPYSVNIVSGLAFGIDTIAHRSALKQQIPTIAVLAHGLDRIYPEQNKPLARMMIEQGGLLTDFSSGVKPDKQNFPRRNRITAGICDAVIVIESGKKGGSLITAELANSYNKDVFAYPGRINDAKSEGCLYLIKQNKACLVSCTDDILETMNWKETKPSKSKNQLGLFPDLNEEEKQLVDMIRQQGQIALDQLYFKTGLSISTIAASLLNLEMNGIIQNLPGKIYKTTG
jgi:DNA processing protein